MSNRKQFAQDIRTPAQWVTAHLTSVNVGYSAIIYSPTNPWEILRGILGSGKKSALTPSRQTRVIAGGDRCRPNLLLLADWAHAFSKYQGAHCTPDDLRRKSPSAPLH